MKTFEYPDLHMYLIIHRILISINNSLSYKYLFKLNYLHIVFLLEIQNFKGFSDVMSKRDYR